MLRGEGDPITDKLLSSRPVKKIIQYLKQNDGITEKELSQLVNVSDKRASKMLIDLENKNILLARGGGKTAQYSLKLVQ
jgi:DeoR/GlpR family transcriptional regulator of sugar metabolism